MDFPQQLEVERPPSSFDVIMESPLCPVGDLDRKGQSSKSGSKFDNSSTLDKMNSSMNSTLDDTTPSDSGVQLLDSESSEFMVESISSQIGFEFEEVKSCNLQEYSASREQIAVIAAPISTVKERHFVSAVFEEIVAGYDTNCNITATDTTNDNSAANIPIEDAMTTSTCSTFDTTENIVYRRKARKAPITPKAPKKRVSFHEDILKNTRTDNIHIEHGFITYKSGRKALQHVGIAGRYSWCSEGDAGAVGGAAAQSELCTHAHENEADQNRCEQRRRCVVYRNACSDVLDYGNSDVYDMEEQKALQYDNSGVFEYMPKERDGVADGAGVGNGAEGQQVLYRCSCSSSNSSLDSDENDKNSNRQQYGQAKSSSCDCIGMSNANNNMIGDNCYFSEPNIDNLNENNPKKSVWNKEKKPKSSCLKKPKRNTNIIYEQDLSTRVKKFNVHDMNQLIDNSSKMIIGSLKSIFTMPLPERGVPEGSEDLQSVVECVPELEQATPEHKSKPLAESIFAPPSPPLKQKPFLSKSLDGSKKSHGVKKFVHNVDEQLRRKHDEEIYAPTRQSSAEKSTTTETPSRVLQRQEEIDPDQRSNLEGTFPQSQLVDSPKDLDTTKQMPAAAEQPSQFRNKFIVNCESTVFEHTGVSYCYDTNEMLELDLDTDSNTPGSIASSLLLETETPIAQPERDHLRSAFSAAPIAKTFSNFFRSFNKDSASTPNARKSSAAGSKNVVNVVEGSQRAVVDNNFSPTIQSNSFTEVTDLKQPSKQPLPNTISSSTISELTNSSACSLPQMQSKATTTSSLNVGSVGNNSNNSLAIGQDLRGNVEKQQRHLPSPLKNRSSGGNLATQPQRYGTSLGSSGNMTLCHPELAMLSPDIFNLGSTPGLVNSTPGGSGGASAGGYIGVRGSCGRDSKSTILSEEFDDIITITTDTDKNESDIVIVDYPSEMSERQMMSDYANLLKPPQPNNAKTSLINRFLRNVTQKKILESSIRKNNFFADKLRSEQKLFSGNLYVPGVKPKNYELIDDLNAEIAMEIEMSGANSPRHELAQIENLPGDVTRFELGIGEISIDIFNGNYFHILKDPSEQLMKVFKLYTGYSREGHMTPVLVFLTDRTLYVTDLVRNRLCSKFVLAYVELDVILMGPFGNTVLLSNSSRDMQQVLLAGGPYPADGLVANLEMCARRSGSSLPAVGQLSFAHLAPLQAFVRENSSVGATDTWMYYAVVNVPAGALGSEQEPLGPHVKGFLMHRRIKDHQSNNSAKHIWNPGYFLLKAGVLYMFNDSTQKIPSWAVALAECQGARRSLKAGRPHCFEIILKGQLLQLAAPDEYVASEWLQALLQTASGLFEMQDKHKTLGCTLVVTQHHLITLREDFSAPLKQIKSDTEYTQNVTGSGKDFIGRVNDECSLTAGETGSLLSSAMSTPTRFAPRSCSSVNSTPTKLSQLSQSTATCGDNTTHSTSTNATTTNATSLATTTNYSRQIPTECAKQTETRNPNMYSVYGKNSGLEILTCADIKEMTGIKIPSHNDTWWCVLEFSCQEVRESTDDLVVFFASSSEMQRFLRLLEQLWQAKNNDLFPITVLDEDDLIAEQCTTLYMDINRAWEPLLSAAMGYPL